MLCVLLDRRARSPMNLLRISSLLLVLLLEPAYGSRVEPKLFTRRAALCFTPAAGLLAAQPALADGEESVAEQLARKRAELAELQRLQEQLAQLEGAAVPPPPPVAAPPPPVEIATAPEAAAPPPPEPAPPPAPLGPSAFDFDVPFRGEPRDIKPFLGKVSLVVNVKFDDPVSLEEMPGLMTLLEKYGSSGAHVLAFPTDQGWFEPYENNALRLNFKSTYDFGQYPTAVVFDKVRARAAHAHTHTHARTTLLH